jgi:hypothetical protein
MSWFYPNLPTWLIGLVIIGAFVVAPVLGLLAFRRVTRGHLFVNEEVNNDIIFFASAGALHRDVTSLPEPARGELQQQLREYNAFIIEQTWPAQRRGEVLDEATRRVSARWPSSRRPTRSSRNG